MNRVINTISILLITGFSLQLQAQQLIGLDYNHAIKKELAAITPFNYTGNA